MFLRFYAIFGAKEPCVNRTERWRGSSSVQVETITPGSFVWPNLGSQAKRARLHSANVTRKRTRACTLALRLRLTPSPIHLLIESLTLAHSRSRAHTHTHTHTHTFTHTLTHSLTCTHIHNHADGLDQLMMMTTLVFFLNGATSSCTLFV